MDICVCSLLYEGFHFNRMVYLSNGINVCKNKKVAILFLSLNIFYHDNTWQENQHFELKRGFAEPCLYLQLPSAIERFRLMNKALQ